MSSYTTRGGDTWDAISFRVYGAERYMDVLIAANPAHVYTSRFNAGVVLQAPSLTPERPTSLPPWRVT